MINICKTVEIIKLALAMVIVIVLSIKSMMVMISAGNKLFELFIKSK